MYTAFASVYDKLMADVDYRAWAAFYQTLLTLYGLRAGKVCECACGTGSLTIPLSEMGYQMTGADLSEEMLFEASQKARKAGAMIPFVKQDMRQLRLHRQMDAVLCTCDGINYLPTPADVRQFFTAAWAAIRPGGALIFDASTPYKLAQVLGVAEPKRAVVTAVETVNPKMPSTLDAAALAVMARRGQITGGLVDGPLAFDNAIDRDAARAKGLESAVAGQADILLVPDIEAGNLLAKQLLYFANADGAGLVLGARVPVILTSRADSVRVRVASVALASLLARAPRPRAGD